MVQTVQSSLASGGLSQIVILVAVIINGNEVGADQIHDGLQNSGHSGTRYSCSREHCSGLYGAAGLGTFGSVIIRRLSAAGCQGKHQAERQHESAKIFSYCYLQ